MDRSTKMDKEVLRSLLERRRRITDKGCWEYTRACTPYGMISISKKMYLVHRVAAWVWKDFDLSNPNEQGHKCDNPPCFNPEHLFETTHKGNMLDAALKERMGRYAKNL